MKIPLDKFEEWLVNKNLKQRTIKEYLYYFIKFNALGSFSNASVGKFLAEKGNKNIIARSFLINLQKFMIKNHKELGISSDMLEDIVEVEMPLLTGHKKKRLVKPLSIQDVYKIEHFLEQEKHKLMLLLSFHCGLRLGELLKIRVISFNWKEWKQDIKQMGECRVYGKGDKEGIALVPPELMIRVARYIRETPGLSSPQSFIFIRGSPSENANISNKALTWRQKLMKAGLESGITQKDDKGSVIEETRIHPHRLRHSCGNYLLNELGLNMREVQEALRHSSITSTEIYTYVDKEKLKKKILGHRL